MAEGGVSQYRLWLLGGGIALFAYVLSRLDAGAVFALVLRVRWNFLWISLLYFVYQLIRTYALALCLGPAGRASWRELAKIRLSGEAVQFLTMTGPFLAEPAKALLLRRHGIDSRRAFAATLAEFLFYLFTSAAISVAGLLYLLRYYPLDGAVETASRAIVYAMGGFLAVAAWAIVYRVYLIGTLLKGATKLPLVGRYLRLDHGEVKATEDILIELLRDAGLVARVTAVDLTAHGLLVTELFLLLRATGEAFHASDPFLLEAATKFIAIAFFFLPGQVGASEGIYAVAFQQAGLSAAAGFALAFARRLRSLLVAGAGLAFSPLWGGGEHPE